MKFGSEKLSCDQPRLGYCCQTATKDSGLENGSGRKSAALMTLKMAVFAPMPSASVSTATTVKPGFFNSWRKANFKSFMVRGPFESIQADPFGWRYRLGIFFNGGTFLSEDLSNCLIFA